MFIMINDSILKIHQGVKIPACLVNVIYMIIAITCGAWMAMELISTLTTVQVGRLT